MCIKKIKDIRPEGGRQVQDKHWAVTPGELFPGGTHSVGAGRGRDPINKSR